MASMALPKGVLQMATMLASLKEPSKPEECISMEQEPETDVILPHKGIHLQVKPSAKPEEELANDPCPEEDDPCFDFFDSLPDIMAQESKKTPRSSYYQWNLPEGLPKDQAGSPNRRLHEKRQKVIVQFMLEVQDEPKVLKREINARRGEHQGFFESVMDLLRCNWA